MYAGKKRTIPLATQKKKKREKLTRVKSEWERGRVRGGGEKEKKH